VGPTHESVRGLARSHLTLWSNRAFSPQAGFGSPARGWNERSQNAPRNLSPLPKRGRGRNTRFQDTLLLSVTSPTHPLYPPTVLSCNFRCIKTRWAVRIADATPDAVSTPAISVRLGGRTHKNGIGSARGAIWIRNAHSIAIPLNVTFHLPPCQFSDIGSRVCSGPLPESNGNGDDDPGNKQNTSHDNPLQFQSKCSKSERTNGVSACEWRQ
jgi:hypothetical protein